MTPPWIITCPVPESANPQPIPDSLGLEALSVTFQIVSSLTIESPVPSSTSLFNDH
jgi:hypothetical protein